jgi:hypothetical protein
MAATAIRRFGDSHSEASFQLSLRGAILRVLTRAVKQKYLMHEVMQGRSNRVELS